GPLRSDPDGRALFHDLMREVAALGRAAGADLTDEFLNQQFTFGDNLPEEMKASMAHDLERGNRLELDWLAGNAVKLGRQYGVPMPANAAIYAVLKPWRMGGSSP